MKKNNKCIKVYVSENEYNNFKLLLVNSGRNMNEFLRKGILAYISKEKTKK